MYCITCGAQALPDSRFCGACGEPRGTPSDADAAGAIHPFSHMDDTHAAATPRAGHEEEVGWPGASMAARAAGEVHASDSPGRRTDADSWSVPERDTLHPLRDVYGAPSPPAYESPAYDSGAAESPMGGHAAFAPPGHASSGGRRLSIPLLAALVVGVIVLAGMGVRALGTRHQLSWSISLSVDTTSANLGQSVALTAQANHDVGPTAFKIVIIDQASGQIIQSCGAGVTCGAQVARYTATHDTFVARVGDQADSSPLTVAWTGSWSVALSANYQEVGDGTTVTLTAQASQDVGPSPYSIEIVNQTTGHNVITCGHGSVCTAHVSSASAATNSYVADVTGGKAHSAPVSVIWDDWSISLTTAQSELSLGGTVTLTAQTDDNVGPLPYSIHIINQDTGQTVGSCGQGTTCTAQVSSDAATSYAFVAEVGSQVSSSVQDVIWNPTSGSSYLGTLNLDSYCQSQGYQQASLDGNTAYAWHCLSSNGSRQNIDMTSACQWQFSSASGRVFGYMRDAGNPYSWECFVSSGG